MYNLSLFSIFCCTPDHAIIFVIYTHIYIYIYIYIYDKRERKENFTLMERRMGRRRRAGSRERPRLTPSGRERERGPLPPAPLLPLPRVGTCNSITWHICTFVSNRGVSGRGLFCWPMMLFRFVIGRKVARRVTRTRSAVSYGRRRVVRGGIWPGIVLRDVCHHQSSHCSLDLRVLPYIGRSRPSRKCPGQLFSFGLFSSSSPPLPPPLVTVSLVQIAWAWIRLGSPRSSTRSCRNCARARARGQKNHR